MKKKKLGQRRSVDKRGVVTQRPRVSGAAKCPTCGSDPDADERRLNDLCDERDRLLGVMGGLLSLVEAGDEFTDKQFQMVVAEAREHLGLRRG